MAVFLGIDTSNYTTSAALYREDSGEVHQVKQPLPVSGGALGLRQSDALFAHVKQLGPVLEELFSRAQTGSPRRVGVSVRPRDRDGSYMPCFLAGEMGARSAAAALGVPVSTFSHQAGHVMAALYGAGRMDLVGRPFLAFHLSGGTTDCLLVSPGAPFAIAQVGASLDLKAGQAVDRVGGLLGLAFPAGPALERLALEGKSPRQVRPVMRGTDCCLSGIENICGRLVEEGAAAADVARCCLDFLGATLEAMTAAALERHPGLPLVYCGGVMANTLIRERITSRFGGASFAPPAYSADNGAGIAILAALAEKEGWA